MSIVRTTLESERGDADRTLGTRLVPWSPGGSDNAFDLGKNRVSLGEVLMENDASRTSFLRADSDQWVSVKGFLGVGT